MFSRDLIAIFLKQTEEKRNDEMIGYLYLKLKLIGSWVKLFGMAFAF